MTKSFLVPIMVMLYNAVYDPDVADNLPQTIVALQQWDGKDLPSEDVYAALEGTPHTTEVVSDLAPAVRALHRAPHTRPRSSRVEPPQPRSA